MSEFYNYAKQSADSSVNWGQVSQDIVNMLDKENLIREEKKTAIDEAYRADLKQLGEAPMGKYQDGNQFIADYSNAATQTALIDNRLLKSGQMDVKTYTFRRQNRLDGTNSLFSLQKAYQTNKQAILDGMDANKLQKTANMYAMQMLEQMGDFSKSKAIIDQTTSSVNIGILEPNPKTGVMEISKNVLPVNVAQKLIFNPVTSFDKDGLMEKWHKTTAPTIMASIIASSTAKTGQIIKLEGLDKLAAAGGLDAYKNIPEYTELKNMVENLNKGNYQFAESATVDPNNTMQILTDYSGHYDINSFTKDVKEAKADPKKILVGVDANGRMTMVKDAPHYAEQRKEANDWLLTDYYRGLKTDVEKAVVSQLQQPRDKSTAELDAEKTRKSSALLMDSAAKVFTAKTPDERQKASDLIISNPLAQDKGLRQIDYETEKGTGKIVLRYLNSAKDKVVSPDEFNSFMNELGSEFNADESVMKNAISKTKGGSYTNISGVGKVGRLEKAEPQEPRQILNSKIDAIDLESAFKLKEGEAQSLLQSELVKYGFTVKPSGIGNNITITAPNKEVFEFGVNESKPKETDITNLRTFLKTIDEAQLSKIKNSGYLKAGSLSDLP